MSKKMFIFGLGYIGEALAARMADQGWQIAGTIRNPDRLAHRRQEGWSVLSYQHDRENSDEREQIAQKIADADILFSTIGLKDGADPVSAEYSRELQAYSGWAGYLSVTSVYASQSEGWVDEHTDARPQSDRGRARLAAEQAWQRLTGAEIFRLGGIYGPKRNPFRAILDGTAQIIDRPGQLFNRMYYLDMVRILEAACKAPQAGRIINLVDGVPAAQRDMMMFSASLLGCPPPQTVSYEEANLSEMGRSFYQTSRRIRSVVWGPEMGVELICPDYKAGLKACLEADLSSGDISL